MENSNMHFVLNGFSEDSGFRVFTFDGIPADRLQLVRMPFTVRIDLALSRKHGIRLQELPLLCRSVLERGDGDPDKRSFTYTEEDMCDHVERGARDEGAKHAKHRPVSPRVGAAWRAPER
jgi:hypothetical protein